MKKVLFTTGLVLLSVISFIGCSDKKVDNVVEGEKGTLTFAVAFEKDDVNFETNAVSVGSRATKSTAIPATSWSNIETIQFLVYNASGAVVYSQQTTPAAGTTSGANRVFKYTDVPAGTGYKLKVIANPFKTGNPFNTGAKIDSYVQGTKRDWNGTNVRSKNLSQLELKYASTVFPAFATSLSAGRQVYKEPAEVFVAEYNTSFNITSGAETKIGNTSPIQLKRDVALMRVRIDYDNSDPGVVNAHNAPAGVDYTRDASIMIYRLPDTYSAQTGVTGANYDDNYTLLVDQAPVYKTANPASPAYNPTTVLTDDFKLWRDIIVLPNSATTTSAVDPTKQYFIVVTAKGLVNHVLADGRKLTTEETVNWSGLIKGSFAPNTIREVNLTLKTGGSTTLPPQPTQEGTLEITLGAPQAWDSNILQEDLNL